MRAICRVRLSSSAPSQSFQSRVPRDKRASFSRIRKINAVIIYIVAYEYMCVCVCACASGLRLRLVVSHLLERARRDSQSRMRMSFLSIGYVSQTQRLAAGHSAVGTPLSFMPRVRLWPHQSETMARLPHTHTYTTYYFQAAHKKCAARKVKW